MTSYEFMVPSEAELVEFFGAGPVERAADDGYWCYEAASDRMRLRFSFDRQERSVQTEVNVAEDPLVTVSHELATRLRRRDAMTKGQFDNPELPTPERLEQLLQGNQPEALTEALIGLALGSSDLDWAFRVITSPNVTRTRRRRRERGSGVVAWSFSLHSPASSRRSFGSSDSIGT